MLLDIPKDSHIVLFVVAKNKPRYSLHRHARGFWAVQSATCCRLCKVGLRVTSTTEII